MAYVQIDHYPKDDWKPADPPADPPALKTVDKSRSADVAFDGDNRTLVRRSFYIAAAAAGMFFVSIVAYGLLNSGKLDGQERMMSTTSDFVLRP